MAVENDLVLIYFEEKPLAFARIESILPDSKKNWYHVKLLLLQIPLQVVTWILKDVYISGAKHLIHRKTREQKRKPHRTIEAPRLFRWKTLNESNPGVGCQEVLLPAHGVRRMAHGIFYFEIPQSAIRIPQSIDLEPSDCHLSFQAYRYSCILHVLVHGQDQKRFF
jgi:hypothetical protein